MRAAPALLALAGLLLLAGTALAATDPKDPQQRHTAADTKLATSIAIRRPDLAAGWKAAKPGPRTACSVEPDESKLVQTARIDPTFLWKDGVTNIGTEVDVFRTKAQARRDWELSTLKLFRACLLESARHRLGPKLKVGLVSAKRLAAPALAERVLHYRIVISVRGKTSVPVVSDVVALGRGRVTVVLHAFSVRTALPDAAIRPLLELLANRLAAGSGASGI